jgi:hypothetical protein
MVHSPVSVSRPDLDGVHHRRRDDVLIEKNQIRVRQRARLFLEMWPVAVGKLLCDPGGGDDLQSEGEWRLPFGLAHSKNAQTSL